MTDDGPEPQPPRENLRYMLVGWLAFGLHGLVLANAFTHPNQPAAWVLWAVALVFCASVIVIAARRSSVITKRYRTELDQYYARRYGRSGR